MNTEEIKTVLKEKFVYPTRTRVAVLAVISNQTTPIDAQKIVSILSLDRSQVDKVTVYRTLQLLEKKSLIQSVDLKEGKTRYELVKDHHHHNFVCKQCGTIKSICEQSVPEIESNILDTTFILEKKYGISISKHTLDFYGTCNNCMLK